MSDFEDSDEERYANESFENETDNEVPEMSEIENEASEHGDGNNDNKVVEEEEEVEIEDEDDLPSVKLNTGPIRRNSLAYSFTNFHKTDAVPYASSSDEEDDVIVGQTLAEINTPSMRFLDETSISTDKEFLPLGKEENHYANSIEEKLLDSSDEVSEEENEEDEEAEFKRIQEMEEKYILQNSAKTPKITQTISAENEKKKLEISSEEEDESDIEDEEEEPENKDNDKNITVTVSKDIANNNLQSPGTMESLREEQNNAVEVIENTLTNLKLLTAQKSEENTTNSKTSESLQLPLNNEVNNTENIDSTKTNSSNISMPLKAQSSIADKSEQKVEKQPSKIPLKQHDKPDVNGYPLIEQEQEVEIDRMQNNSNNVENYENDYDEEDDVVYYDNQHFDYHITSKTPTSFNSDDYIFHANFIKQFHRTNSTDKLRPKPHPRKSMSFSNERMREIERHNQILLRKILTQKPTYNLKSKSSQTSLQKVSTQTTARLTTSALNRKKQQRQIDMDNQLLKRKIEAIAMRRRPLIS